MLYVLVQGGVEAQAGLSGRTIDTSSRMGIPGVRVSAHSENGRELAVALSDSIGGFRFALEPGKYLLRTSRIGYAPTESRKFELNDREQIDLLVQLAVEAVSTDPLVIVMKRTLVGRLIPYYERLDRRDVNGGHFITRAQIDSLGVGDITAHIEQSGVPMETSRRGERWPLGYGRCRMRVFLDDVPMEGFALDAMVHADNIEGVEIYRSSYEAPARYSDRLNTCGVLLLWTRADRTGTLTFWKGLLVGAGSVTVALLGRWLWQH